MGGRGVVCGVVCVWGGVVCVFFFHGAVSVHLVFVQFVHPQLVQHTKALREGPGRWHVGASKPASDSKCDASAEPGAATEVDPETVTLVVGEEAARRPPPRLLLCRTVSEALHTFDSFAFEVGAGGQKTVDLGVLPSYTKKTNARLVRAKQEWLA